MEKKRREFADFVDQLGIREKYDSIAITSVCAKFESDFYFLDSLKYKAEKIMAKGDLHDDFTINVSYRI